MAAAGSLNFTLDEGFVQDIYNRPSTPSLSFTDRAKPAIHGLAKNLNSDNVNLFVNTGVRQLESLHSVICNEQGSKARNNKRVAAILTSPFYPASLLENEAKLWLNGMHRRLAGLETCSIAISTGYQILILDTGYHKLSIPTGY